MTIRQRWHSTGPPSTALRRLLVGALLLVGAGQARAQQVFVKHLWVHDTYPGRGCSASTLKPGQFTCGDNLGRFTLCQVPGICANNGRGNISNSPQIQFDRIIDGQCGSGGFCQSQANALSQSHGINCNNVCHTSLFLCAKVGWANQQSGNSTFALDFLQFEVFKFGQGSNPLDPQSTPPLRTFFVDDPGIIGAGTNSDDEDEDGLVPPVCVLWDGSINIQGELGKSNGQYGFRATVATNQTGASGNINITQTRAYPSGAALDSENRFQEQKPIIIDVVNVHVVRSSPTVIGELTGVAAEPYNITYRLSKDANVDIDIQRAVQGSPVGSQLVRKLVPNLPRVGEGTPVGTLQNGDAWNGRADNGDLLLPGIYIASITASAHDQFGFDQSDFVSRQISLDPLQITDIRVQPLLDQSTSLAVISYLITEPAKVYLDIYPPGTQFLPDGSICSGKQNLLNNINDTCQDQDPSLPINGGAPKNFNPFVNGARVAPLRHMEEQQDFRRSVISFWDGRDSQGRLVDDGDYVFVLYADLPSANGNPFRENVNDRRIWSSNAKSGFITVTRGLVTISQIGPSSTVIGSSPPVAGLDPFTFSYSLSRDSNVTLKILRPVGGPAGGPTNPVSTQLVRTLVNNEQRPGAFLNRERWFTPTDEQGLWLSSGNYIVELTARDAFFPSKVSTTTAVFPVNLFRITDVFSTPLLTNVTDVITLSYQLSQPMQVVWSIYPPGSMIVPGSGWPPGGVLEPGPNPQVLNNGSPVAPVTTIKGVRPGRLRITEFWDGRDQDGLFVPDGMYLYTLVARSTTTPAYFASDQIFGTLTVARGSIVFPIFNVTPTTPQLFNSSQTVSLPPYEIDYSLTRQSSVTIQVLTTTPPPKVIRTLISGQVRDANIVNREFWDGRDDAGNFVRQGFYTIRAVAEDLAAVLSSGSTAQQTVSVDPLRIYDVAVSPLRADFGTALIAYQVSETMKVSIKIFKPGTVFDPGGNPTPPEATSLVKRIVGVRPARTEITESWDGTDERLSLVPDGNYIFKIVASTDINSINTITGDVRPGASLAEDLIIAEVPVVRGGALDPLADFTKNSFVYPNPVRGPSGTFQIYVPIQANVFLKIYNIAGELVLDKSFGQQAADSYVNFNWPKTNHAGRPLAHGVYFALIREEPTRGEKTPLQVVKKILIP